MWWWLVGCEPGSGTTDGSHTTPTPDADVWIDVGPPDAAVGPVPCEHVHEVRIVNQDDVEHEVLSVTFTPLEGPVRLDAWDLDVPQIVRPGRAMTVPLRSVSEVPVATAGRLSIETDLGRFEALVEGELNWGDERDASFTVPVPLVDVILAVDQTSNMGPDHADELAAGIGGYLDALTAAADWRLALVHTEDACADGGVFTAADRDAAAYIGNHAFDGDPQHFLNERLLELASRALAENAPTECNGDFHRAEAQLQVVVVSDEPEQSDRSAAFWVADYHVYADEVVVSGIVDENHDCNGGAAVYADAIRATGGVSLDLCDPGWPDEFPRIADALVPQHPVFGLDGGAVAPSIVATVDGSRVPVRWDPTTSSVVVEEILAPGVVVDVHWAVPAVCEAP